MAKYHTTHRVVSLGYAVSQIGLGLLLHPYQTMQSLVEERVFVWMSLLPAGILAVVTIVWRYLLVPVVQMVFSCQKSGFVACDWLALVSNWLSFFMIYWQILLLYLLFRFRLVWKAE